MLQPASVITLTHPQSSYLHSTLPYLWRRKWQPTPVFSPGESHGQRATCPMVTRVGHHWVTNPPLTLYGLPSGGSVVKNPPARQETIPGLGRSPGGGHGNPLQYSCLENPMDRGAWWSTVHRVAKNWTWLKWLSTHACPTLRNTNSNKPSRHQTSHLLWRSLS